jgi:uncharacterized membrane protein
MRIASAGHAAFAAILIALGLQGLIQGDFTAVWQPVPKGIPARQLLAYGCAGISLASGICLLWKRVAVFAARALLASLLLWLLVWRVPEIVRAPIGILSWDGWAETAAVTAGAWILYATLPPDGGTRWLGLGTGQMGVRVARVLYALALIPFGLAHFAYIKETAALVPGWLPWHRVWAMFTGSALLVASAAVLLRLCARLAVSLSALEIGLFTVLVWGPVVVASSPTPYQWSELAISSAVTAAAWVVADSYRGSPWLHTAP